MKEVTREAIEAYLQAAEDLLFEYLERAVITRHPRDWGHALVIANVLGADLDLGYLYTKAHWRRDGRFVDDLDRLLAGKPLRSEPSAW